MCAVHTVRCSLLAACCRSVDGSDVSVCCSVCGGQKEWEGALGTGKERGIRDRGGGGALGTGKERGH
jgi:hypothetical protein